MSLDIHWEARWSLSSLLQEDRLAQRVIASVIDHTAMAGRSERSPPLEVIAVIAHVATWYNLRTLHEWLIRNDPQDDRSINEALLDALESSLNAVEEDPTAWPDHFDTQLGRMTAEEMQHTREAIQAARRLLNEGWELNWVALW